MHATKDLHAGAAVLAAVVDLLGPLAATKLNNLGVDLTQLDPLGFGQAGILSDDNLLSLLKSLLALGILLLLPQSQLLLFASLLLLLLDPVGGFLERSLGGRLVCGSLLIALLLQ